MHGLGAARQPARRRRARPHSARPHTPPRSQGLDWVAQHHVRPAVVHMSVEGGYSSVVNHAVDQLIANHKLHVVVSSGEALVLPHA